MMHRGPVTLFLSFFWRTSTSYRILSISVYIFEGTKKKLIFILGTWIIFFMRLEGGIIFFSRTYKMFFQFHFAKR
jgi:hypothetical protein